METCFLENLQLSKDAVCQNLQHGSTVQSLEDEKEEEIKFLKHQQGNNDLVSVSCHKACANLFW